MKTKAAVLHSNHYIVLAFLAALCAFVFASQANARSPVLKAKKTPAVKKNNSVMFMNLKQRKLLAQNTAAAAADAKLEGEFLQDSQPIAQPAASSIATTVKKTSAENAKGLEFGGTLVIGTNRAKTSEEKNSYSGTYTLVPGMTHAESNVSLTAALEYNREYSYELDDQTDGDWSNIAIKANKKVGLNDFGLSYGPRLTIGMGKEAKRQTFKGALGAGLSANKKLGKVTLTQGVSYSYRLFEYDIRDDGTVNSPHALDESTGLSVQVTDWIELQSSFGISLLRSFQGVVRTFSTTAIGVNFNINKNTQLGMGMATLKKNTLEPSGQGNRVKLWDKTDAVASIELGLSI